MSSYQFVPLACVALLAGCQLPTAVGAACDSTHACPRGFVCEFGDAAGYGHCHVSAAGDGAGDAGPSEEGCGPDAGLFCGQDASAADSGPAGCGSDVDCPSGERCCEQDGQCHPTIADGQQCSCQRPCSANEECSPGICNSIPLCRPVCFPGSSSPPPYGTAPARCPDQNGMPAFCTPASAAPGGTGDGGPDAGAPDAGSVIDAGRDAGALDGGPVDGGNPDGGVPDAGTRDGGSADAGRADGGPDAGNVAQNDAGNDAGSSVDASNGVCIEGDNCDPILQNCPSLPLDRSQPATSPPCDTLSSLCPNPTVPYNCVPAAPGVTECVPAGPIPAGGTGCNQQCGSIAGNCAKGAWCTQPVDQNGNATAPPTCDAQCRTPTQNPADSAGCTTGYFCDAVFGLGMVFFSTGVCTPMSQ
jgi:hypothetical protein